MRARLFRLLAAVALAWLGACAPASADTPITLFKSFAGNINMTGTQKTLRTRSNDRDPCATASSVTLNLSGLPGNSTVLAAYLYWAGSGSTGDYTITFDGTPVTAPPTRRYSSGTVGYDYFGGAADVTSQVKAKGNDNYTVSGLDIEKSLFCAVQGVLGGFQLLVVYSHSQETFRVLNIYEGFQYIRNSSVELTLTNFQIPNPIGSLTGRVGHITWEGDPTLSGGGETLRYNGVEQTDYYNPSGNQFNSISSINADLYSYGIDFDVYTIRSPVISSGQKSAKTTYTSGQDLVLLNAEVVAAPNVPATDRGVTLTLNGNLMPSAATTYTITAVNNGPMDEGGPVTVKGTLPASLIYGGATGSGWSCGVQGQLLTCTYTGLFKVNTTLPPITLTVTPAAAASGLIVFGVTIGGKLFDYYDGNDTSTVSARVGKQDFIPSFIFTDRQCAHNKPFGDPAQPCKPLVLDTRSANTDISTWITYVVKGVPTALANGNTTLPMRFALSCHDPETTAGTRATYSLRSVTVSIPPCDSKGVIPEQRSAAWSTATNVMYPGGSPSSQATTAKNADDLTDFLLRYQDVGRIELFVTDDQARMGSTGAFVSRPEGLLLLAQSSNKAGDPATATDPRFVPAGTPFTMTVQAVMQGLTTPPPNFGRESDPVKVKLRIFPASTADGSPIAAMLLPEAPVDTWDNPEERRPPLVGTFGPFVRGVATGSEFVFDDVGVIRVESTLARTDDELRQKQLKSSYLGSGNLDGVPINVGRFFPAWFDTAAQGAVACIAAAQCPAPKPDPEPVRTIGTMAYSGQPFEVAVTARSAKGTALRNYRLELARDVALSAFTEPNGTTQQTMPMSGTAPSVLSNTAIAASAFDKGVARTSTPTYTFPAGVTYKRSEPSARYWQLPVSLYVRATESSGTDKVTSRRDKAVEGGVQVAAGRLHVDNVSGSANQMLSVGVKAQFYGSVNDAKGWYDSTADSSSVFGVADARFSACVKLPGARTCSVNPAVDKGASGTLANGVGALRLAAPGPGSSGLVYLWFETAALLGSPAWLPSVQGSVTYGTVPKRPYTYLREMY